MTQTRSRSRTMGAPPEGTEPAPTVETVAEGEVEEGQDPPGTPRVRPEDPTGGEQGEEDPSGEEEESGPEDPSEGSETEVSGDDMPAEADLVFLGNDTCRARMRAMYHGLQIPCACGRTAEECNRPSHIRIREQGNQEPVGGYTRLARPDGFNGHGQLNRIFL